MNPFFIEDQFYSSIEDYLIDHELEKEDVEKLPDDFKLEVMDTSLPIFVLKEHFVVDAIVQCTDSFEERFPEDSDKVFVDIKEAIKQSIDMEKLNSLLPKLWYPIDKTVTITKEDLLDACS